MEDALALDSVYRAVSIIQGAAAQLSLDAWKQGRPMENPSSIITAPSLVMPRSEFIGLTVTSLATRGNAYWLINRKESKILDLAPLDPLEVTPVKLRRAGLAYSFRGKEYTPDQIAHMRLLALPGRLEGIGPIQAAAHSLSGALNLSKYAQGWVTQGATPNGILQSDQSLTAQMAKEYKQQWRESVSMANGPAVLGSGLTYKPLMLKPSEIQWLESQSFNVTQVARLFGIPAALMLATVEGNSLTYANIEQMEISFIRYTLMQYLRPIEEAMTRILPGGQTARFNLDALLRTDTASRYAAYKTAIEAGFMTIDEIREIEKLPPLQAQGTHDEETNR